MKQTSSKLKPILNNDKIEQLIRVLQNYIIDGNLKPGDHIPAERDLAAQLGVSRFSLREALRVAQAQGLIEITRGRQPTVARPSAIAAAKIISLTLRRTGKALFDLIEARQSVECGIARCAALHAKPSHIKAMNKTIDDLNNNKNNLADRVEKDIEFHNILVKASGNKVFEIILAPLAELLKKSRTKTMKVNVERAVLGHRRILEAVIKKDAGRAAQAMYNHLKMAEEDLKKITGVAKCQK